MYRAFSGAPVERVQWVDLAKGWCIVLVVTMHSTLGVGVDLNSTNWLHAFVAFAKPFRMPDFFMVAGLMAGGAVTMPWRRFLDRKILHFVYFYALWLGIVLLAKSGQLGLTSPSRFLGEYIWSMIEPFSTLWFIHLLPLLFLAIRIVGSFDRLAILALAIVLHILAAEHPAGGAYAMASVWTGWTTLDSFALFFVYFYVGHIGREWIFRLAAVASRRPASSFGVVLVWSLVQVAAVRAGLTEIPGVTLLAGFSGALAVVTAAALLARFSIFRPLAYCGRNSLAIYLSFVLPMAAARAVLLKTGAICDVGLIAALVTFFAIIAPLTAKAVVEGTRLSFVFVRPIWARLREQPAGKAGCASVSTPSLQVSIDQVS